MTVAAITELCPGCFLDKGHVSLCPRCGYNESFKRGPLVLPHRALLHQGQYLIGRVLGKLGGFGITYLALDTHLETRVAIKEYLPRDLAGRDGGKATISAHSVEDGEFFRYGLTQFLQEARTLAQFDHANIVRVRNFFEENGTGYLVMDYYDGITLADYLAQQPQGRLPEKTAVGILMPILDALREVHAKNFLHRDIKPQNIYLTTGSRPILLDFGAARQAMSERSRSLSVVLSEGYAPYEQYHRRGEQGPWTDIYACAAVLYHAVAGEAPPPAAERVHKDELDIAVGVSKSLANALRHGLAPDHHNRPQRMTEFQALLLGDSQPSDVKMVGQKPKKDDPSTPSNKMVAPFKPAQRKDTSAVTVGWLTALALVIVVATFAIVNAIAIATTGNRKGNKTVANPSAPVVAEAEIRAGEDEPPLATITPDATADGQHTKSTLVTYKTEDIEQGGIKMTTLVVTLDGKRLEGPKHRLITITAQKDFNGDGINDVLIHTDDTLSNIYDSGTSEIVTVTDGKIIVLLADILVRSEIIAEGGRFLFKDEYADATYYRGFDGRKIIEVRKIPKKLIPKIKLETIVEIVFNTEFSRGGETETLTADLDLDGTPDRIECRIHYKWGYTSCALPLTGGGTQDINFGPACYRIGVLKTMSKGYRELVCDDNAVIRFNGEAWAQIKPAR